MTMSDLSDSLSLLLIVAGAKGAVGSTLTVTAAALRCQPEAVLPSLTTENNFPYLGPPQAISVAGWDSAQRTMVEAIEAHGVLPAGLWRPYSNDLAQVQVLEEVPADLDLQGQVDKLRRDIQMFRNNCPGARAVFINLLPATVSMDLKHCQNLRQLHGELSPGSFPDIAYTVAAIRSGLPVVNFTPNEVEIPYIIDEAARRGVPISGRDGKTGQTYLKVVLASALKARRLSVDGWYSLNILGNEDGRNLKDPKRAAAKLTNKTKILDEVLGYRVGERYGVSSHKVQIDYYPPRGDAKEAWDVIDFLGLFGLPMSIRLNLQARDSVLAAPLVLDLARWMIALQLAGRSGPIPELGFYYKKPVGDSPPLTFQDQVAKLRELEVTCDQSVSAMASHG